MGWFSSNKETDQEKANRELKETPCPVCGVKGNLVSGAIPHDKGKPCEYGYCRKCGLFVEGVPYMAPGPEANLAFAHTILFDQDCLKRMGDILRDLEAKGLPPVEKMKSIPPRMSEALKQIRQGSPKEFDSSSYIKFFCIKYGKLFRCTWNEKILEDFLKK